MKKIIALFFLSIFSSNAFTQKALNIPQGFYANLKTEQSKSILDLPKTSNYTRMMFLDLKKVGWSEEKIDFSIPDSIANQYFLTRKADDYYVNSFIILTDTISFSFLDKYNIT